MFLRILLLLISPLFFLPAQNEWFYFEEQTKNVGDLDFKVSRHQFVYAFYALKNVRIKKIETDCACLISNYTESYLEYGQQGFIRVVFEPYKYGYFEKKIKVVFENKTKNVRTHLIYLQGNILPSEEEELKTFNYSFGPIKTKRTKLNLGKVKNNRVLRQTFKIYNSAAYPVKFTGVKHPAHIKIIDLKSKQIRGETLESLELYYNTNQKKAFGLVQDEVSIYLEGQKTIVIPLTVEAIILKNTDKTFPDLSPRLVIEDTLKDLGKTPIILPLEVGFTLKNEGKGLLTIFQIIVPSDCEVRVGKEDAITLKNGEAKDIHIRVNKTDKKGKQVRTLTIFSDDYLHPEQRLTLKFKL